MPHPSENDIVQIGHYQVRHKIAEGGFGAVFLAFDPRLERDVAIKLLHGYHAMEADHAARFVREARSAARLNHPGIVQIYDVVEEKDRMAIVMEYIQGSTLGQYLRDHPELSLQQKLFIAADIAETLYAAHKEGIIHRDVKPGNVMLDQHGHVKLTDFSLARLVDTSLTPLTGENCVLGTPAYMSPEQCQGYEAVPQSDLYSLGVIIYEMVSGSLPFEAENYLALLRHHTDTPPTPVRLLRPSLPLDLERVVMQCLAKHIDQRPASGLELAEALRRLALEQCAPNASDINDPANSDTVALSAPHTHTPSTPMTPVPAAPASPTPAPGPGPLRTATPTPMGMTRPSGVTPPSLPPGPTTPTPAPMLLQTPSPMPQPVPRDEPEVPEKGFTPHRRPMFPWIGLATVVMVLCLALGYWMYQGGGSGDREAITVGGLLSATPLKDYVTAEDDNYSYRQNSIIEDEGYTAYVLDMTSQTWHADKVSPPVWKHWLTIIVPDNVAQDTAMLAFSEGFSTATRPLSEVPIMLLATALSTRSVVAVLEGYPRDPVGIHDDPNAFDPQDRNRLAVESFSRFLDTGDPTWPIVCPLVKSAVRAMDTVQGFTEKELSLETPIKSFVLTGEADGWGVWLTGAVDKRVAAIAPIQFDLLNINRQAEHQIGFRGALSPFMSLMSESGVLAALDTKQGEQLLRIIDPYAYRNLLTMPKLLLLPSSSNPYTTIDAATLYMDGLQGENYLFCAPNLRLSRGNPFLPQQGSPVELPQAAGAREYAIQDFRNTLQVFYHRILVGKPMPAFTWEVGQDGHYKVTTEEPPVEVRLWLAHSKARDFSYREAETEFTGEEPEPLTWRMERLTYNAEGYYEGTILSEETGYTAFYIELVYPSKLDINFGLTTPTTIIETQPRPSQVLEVTPETTDGRAGLSYRR